MSAAKFLLMIFFAAVEAVSMLIEAEEAGCCASAIWPEAGIFPFSSVGLTKPFISLVNKKATSNKIAPIMMICFDLMLLFTS
jgi:hypothetical protein